VSLLDLEPPAASTLWQNTANASSALAMPQLLWHRTTGHMPIMSGLVRFSLLILIRRFVTLEP
jgi:hypothetical protein